ncbi:MAG TPA: MauE/DoxX family redox-associated membrane protein [Acidimicrobiales bacterium]|jgi:hypothetical protein|nr:MauE/DoxX family redox-associated membrane protein [Acidimicrobiales bacterium]
MAGLGYACALLLAAVFVRAGAAKLARPGATAATFAQLRVPAAAALARTVPVVELLVAAGLLAAPRVGATVALVLLAGFSAVLARAVRSGTVAPCNCFGTARADPVSSSDLLRNGLLAALALAALAAGRPTLPSAAAALAGGAGFGAGAAILAAARRRLAT